MPTNRSQRVASTRYIIPDFEKGLGEFAEGVLSISPTNYDLAPALSDPFRKRFGYFMVHEAIEQAVALDVLVQAIERAKSPKPKADRSLARCALRRWLDQSNARRCGSIRSDRPEHAFGTDHGSVAQQGAGDGLAEGRRQGFPGVAVLNGPMRPKSTIQVTSAYPPGAELLRTSLVVRFVPMNGPVHRSNRRLYSISLRRRGRAMRRVRQGRVSLQPRD